MNLVAAGRGFFFQAVRSFVKDKHPLVVGADVLRVVAILVAPALASWWLQWVADQDGLVAPLHRRLQTSMGLASLLYRFFVVVGVTTTIAALSRSGRNFLAIATDRIFGTRKHSELPPGQLPPYPYDRESFALVLGELHSRDGTRVPNVAQPKAQPKWLVLPELALYTGVFVTGTIGSGKTAALAYPALKQLIGFRREVRVRRPDGSSTTEEWKFSGLILDEKGDFTRAAAGFCKEWGRENDLIRIAPGGKWIWNVIYNPNLSAWAVGYQLGWILNNVNKNKSGSDPFWEQAPRELITEYLGLLDDAEGYYTLFDYLEVLIDTKRQDDLQYRALSRFSNNPSKLSEIERRWKAIERRRNEMGVNLRGSLEACARAGMDMFRYPELRKTFCPTREEYFEEDQAGKMRPRANVFTGFDQTLEEGKIVGIEMSKNILFDAARFCQVALKSQWQDSVLRRDTMDSTGRLIQPPKFGERIGYCPTFLMADEAQLSATPRDGEFKAVCRSKRASMWELTQSHSSIKSEFGSGKEAAAATYFQNSQTHIYLRQSDLDSMKHIQEQVGKKLIQKTSLTFGEGGSATELDYFEGQMIHQGINLSSSKTVSTEEKPFLELEELRALPNNVAVVTPSNGERALPATFTYLRPLWVFKKYKNLQYETSWFDWPLELRSNRGLDDLPQEYKWAGWVEQNGERIEAVDQLETVAPDVRLGRFLHDPLPFIPPPPPPPAQPDGEDDATAGKSSEEPSFPDDDDEPER